MRRATSLLVLLLAMTIVATAQTHYEANISVGGKAGMTLSRINFQPSVPQSLVGGFVVGGSFRYMEEKHFGVIAELNVEQRGWKEKFEGYNLSYSRKFTYLQLPIMTHVYFGSDKFHAFFNAGPALGVMIGESTTSNFDYNHIDDIQDFPRENRYTDQMTLPVERKFDYGITAGVGMEYIARHKQSFSLEGRVYYGLGDVFSNKKSDTFSGSGGLSIAITLGYYYRIK